MYALVVTSRFEHRIAKFKRAHPEIDKQLAKVLRDLESDPFQGYLRLHPLKGELEGLHSVSVTHAYRITLTLKVTKREIVLLDIGSHDDVYR